MSMHNLASNLQSAGRGQDSVLVHMTPKEVGGLQALAMAHGGTLTINPHTGLPEAGFLSSILPMALGAALAATGVGAPMAAMMIGGGYTVATGSLKKGLMAGLGAYGGYGIAGALGSAGVEAANLGLSGAGAGAGAGAATTAGVPAMTAGGGAGLVAPTAATNGMSLVPSGTGAAVGEAALKAPINAVNPSLTSAVSSATEPVLDATINAATQPTLPAAETLAKAKTYSKPLDIGDTFSERSGNIGKGFSKLFEDSDAGSALRSDLWKNHRREVIAAGMSALSGMEPTMPKLPNQTYPEWDPNYRAYRTYNPSERAPGSTSERMYFADGGLMTLAGSSMPVENMSMQNETGYPQAYPMAQQQNNAYTVSSSRPISGEVLSSGVDTAVNPYTGETRFADGGSTDNPFIQSITKNFPLKNPTSKTSSVYTPKYKGYDYSTGQWILNTPEPAYTPYTTLPKLSTQRTITTPDMVTNLFMRTYGRAPTDAELQQYTNRGVSEKKLSKMLRNSQTFRAKDNWDVNELTNYFQGTLGRAPTQEEIARFTNPKKQFGMKKLYQYATKQPEYLKVLNTYGQKAFDTEQALTKKEEPRDLVTPTGIASTYKDVFGKPPTMDFLNQYKGQDITQQELKNKLMGSDEYMKKLTQPFIPEIKRNPSTGLASIEGALNAPQPMNAPMDDFYAQMRSQLNQQMAEYAPPQPIPVGGYAGGGLSHLGDYSDGGRLLRGPGDGVSDSIPAVIGQRQPARLADGEFVVPARIVSELGNGSTEAGAKRLYAMMDRIQRARRKTVGKGKVAHDTNAEKYLPA